MSLFANVIVDISIEKLDRPFQYIIPDALADRIYPGVQIEAPFGNRTIKGYVIEITDTPEIALDRIKPISGVLSGSVAMESQLIELAAWMRANYGSTMNQALKTVLPVRKKTKPMERKWLELIADENDARMKLAIYESGRSTAKARLLRELIVQKRIEQSLVTAKLNISSATIKSLEKDGMIAVSTEKQYRNPIANLEQNKRNLQLNPNQKRVVDAVLANVDAGIQKTYLLKGVTGSGKTEVYMELIAHAIGKGQQAIVLIPEIALTYQTVMRFYNRFGDRVSIMNSRLSDGERYDQYLRVLHHDVDIIIGPRSALFAPFENLGLIIIDEEHETSYKSETAPRYHAREVAIQRAKMCHASVVLGSATPSMESYYRAMEGEYELLELNQRVQDRPLAQCEVIDMREELRHGNRSILSTRLQERMEECLQKNEQMMLFLNRRGTAGFVSCRACGTVIKCPHCDVSLSQHRGGRLVCHYCGYEIPQPKTCPECGSKYIMGFKAGTQKVEEFVQKRFPDAKILRMDYDSTRTKDSYESILNAFANHEADILIGTQMIVKGHDFAGVTLVGILAADMSLHVPDFHGTERTFDLITQAAGRAGRGDLPGNVVIQSYDPDNYAIQAAKNQDYDAFYRQEIAYRGMMNYPPVNHMLVIGLANENEQILAKEAENITIYIEKLLQNHRRDCAVIGPADASIAKMNDIYRKVIYIKSKDYSLLVAVKDRLEKKQALSNIQYDFDPMSGF
ncbi:replication restart helicase PriA [Agathobacter sp.]|uniref:replication restart helicase PriA n=1 Tax=Agathobacter sp. TaxID=2021311 RepID=UPI0025900840|nr:primosomal protein N' [Agathobacter sp.]